MHSANYVYKVTINLHAKQGREVALVEVDSDDKTRHLELESDDLGRTHASSDNNNPWEVTLHLNGEKVLLRIVTRANVIVNQRKC